MVEKTILKFEESILKAMQENEGLTIEEAKLSYAQRQNLPDSAFCGPNRTYPAHDAAHIRNAIVRLMTHKPKGYKKILKCVCGRAKKAGVESEVCKQANFNESKILEWFESRHKKDLCAEC